MENKGGERMDEEKSFGNIQIDDEVIANIAGTAATEIDGVYSMCGNVKDGIIEFFGKREYGKGVSVKIEGNIISIGLSLVVKYGVSIPKIAFLIQSNVKKKVEEMTGLQVKEVNVNIKWVHFEEETK